MSHTPLSQEVQNMLLEDVLFLRHNLHEARALLDVARTWVNNSQVADRIEEFLKSGSSEPERANISRPPLRAI